MSETVQLADEKQSLLEDTPLKPDAAKKVSDSFHDDEIKEFDIGIWHIKVALPRGRFAVKHYIDTFRTSLPLVRRLATDIWALSPPLMTLYLLCQFWDATEGAMTMQLTGTLLRKVRQKKSCTSPILTIFR